VKLAYGAHVQGLAEVTAGVAKSDEKVAVLPKAETVTSNIPPLALDTLNWLRGLSAIAVFANHLRGAFVVDFAHAKPTIINRIFYLLTGGGHQAVNVFFVLSGFFISTSVAVSSQRGAWSWERFALRRFTRLYAVLIPALILTAFWDQLGMALFGTDGIYSGSVAAAQLRQPDVRQTSSLIVFLGNLVFVQDIFVTTFGSNFPLWSLGYEFWAYLVFPLLFRAATKAESPRARALYVVIAALLLALGGKRFCFYFVVWGLGALVALLWTHERWHVKSRALVAVAGVVFVGAYFAARVRIIGREPIDDMMVGLTTAAFIAAVLGYTAGVSSGAESSLRRAYSRLGEGVASYSYSLYVAHLPILTFFQAGFVGRHQWPSDIGHVALVCVVGVLIVALYVYPFSRLTEGRTDAIRRAIERRIHGVRRARA
jgi:peptidoglycan/LPS O-acetylase OafA/YrhL